MKKSFSKTIKNETFFFVQFELYEFEFQFFERKNDTSIIIKKNVLIAKNYEIVTNSINNIK